jgi:hypothetical protein
VKQVYLGGKYGAAAGRVTLVDNDEDYDLASRWFWQARKDGRTFYAQTSIVKENGVRTSMLLHRLLTGFQWARVDHVDHNGLNNTRVNLRDGTVHNMKGQRSHVGSSSDWIGVVWNKDHAKWEARVKVGGTDVYLGFFDSEVDAAHVRDEYVRTLPHADQRTYNFRRPGEQSALEAG